MSAADRSSTRRLSIAHHREVQATLNRALDDLDQAIRALDELNARAKTAGLPRHHALRRIARRQAKHLHREFAECLTLVDALRQATP